MYEKLLVTYFICTTVWYHLCTGQIVKNCKKQVFWRLGAPEINSDNFSIVDFLFSLCQRPYLEEKRQNSILEDYEKQIKKIKRTKKGSGRLKE